MVATFHNPATNSSTTLVLKGDFWGGSADIAIEDGPVVAQISRKLFNAREFWGDKQTVRLSDLIYLRSRMLAHMTMSLSTL